MSGVKQHCHVDKLDHVHSHEIVHRSIQWNQMNLYRDPGCFCIVIGKFCLGIYWQFGYTIAITYAKVIK